MSRKLNVGVIGLGSIGSTHLNALQANAHEARITALCDIVPEKLNFHGDRLKITPRYENYRDLLKTDVDAVSICVENNLHKEIALAALKAGKHVLLEKPMAMNALEAREIIAAAEASGKILQIGMVWRQHRQAQQVRQLVQDGVFGEIYHIRAVLTRRRGIPGLGGWFTTKSRSGGGPLIDLGVHWFDIAMHLSGLWNPTSVTAVTYAPFASNMKQYCYTDMWAGPPKYDGVCDVEDYAAGLVRFGTKATLNFEISWAANVEEECFIELLGSKGGVKILDGKPLKIRTEFQGRVTDVLPAFEPRDEWFNRQHRLFLDACRGECPPAATAQEGLIVMKLIDAVYQSSALGREVTIS
jgi:predicted dehydrogenase